MTTNATPIADTAKETKEKAAAILLSTKSVLFNAKDPFTYTSGRQGPVYVDCRRLISFPQERKTLMDMAAEMITDRCGDIDYLAGGETAGIPYAAYISDRLDKPMLYVRKKPKGFGRMAQIEGHMEDGKTAMLIEDLQTDGGSKKIFINALREAGATVAHSFVIFHYGIFERSRTNMEKAGVTLHYLTDWWSVLDVANRQKSFDEDTLLSVARFLDNPETWQTTGT